MTRHTVTEIVALASHSMSADPAANLQVFSPPGSGRSSPAPRSLRIAAEERMTSSTLQTHHHRLIELGYSSLQERQRLSTLCSWSGTRPGSLGYSTAGMGGLYLVPGETVEGQSLNLMPLCSLALIDVSARPYNPIHPKYQSSHIAPQSHCG